MIDDAVKRLKDLFGRYVATVAACEGTDYLGCGYGPKITQDEQEEIRSYFNIVDEAYQASRNRSN